jgi:hypothetical protein
MPGVTSMQRFSYAPSVEPKQYLCVFFLANSGVSVLNIFCYRPVFHRLFFALHQPNHHSPTIQAEESDDLMTLSGTVEFADIETAKAVVEKYNGMDMGMGSALEIEPV